MSSKSLLLALVLVMGAVMMGWQVARQWTPALDQVAIAGDLDQRQRNRVFEVLLAHRDQMNDIDDIGAVLGALDWVHRIRVRRSWPDGLIVEVIKQSPIAYWNDDAFINADGDVFESPYADLSKLPQLYGPAGSEREVMSQYQSLAKSLSRIEQGIDTLRLDDRGSWHFVTSRGIKVMLGKEDTMDRIQRFLFVMENARLSTRLDDIEQIDTRYSRGLAVSWVDAPPGLAVANSDNRKRETRL